MIIELALPLSRRFKFRRKIIPFRSHKFILSLHSARMLKTGRLISKFFLASPPLYQVSF